MSEKKNEFGEYVANKRKEKGKTIRPFAKEVGISPAYLSDLETGRRPVANGDEWQPLLKAISDVLGFDAKQEHDLRLFADKSLLENNKLSSDVGKYLRSIPFISELLRKAFENNVSIEKWQQFLNEIEKKD